MKSESENNIASIKHAKAQAGLLSGTIRQGWDITDADLQNIRRPVMFYICEPLTTGSAAYGVFDVTALEHLLKNENKGDGIADELFSAVNSVTKDWIADPAAATLELMDAVLTGNLLTFCGGKEAWKIVEEKICHFGIIVYRNPSRKDEITITLRPLKISDQRTIEKEDLVHAVAWYMFNDAPLLPASFEGVNVLNSAVEFAKTIGTDPLYLYEAFVEYSTHTG